MTECLLCKGTCEPFISLGPQPIANGFLGSSEFASEPFYDLTVGFCSSCSMVQLLELVERGRMFHENYAFFSGTSARMAEHFKRFASRVIEQHQLARDSFVVEIGSNDGIMLQHFAEKGIRHVGIEPSLNVAEVARTKRVNTISHFFDEHLAREIVAEYGQADAFLGANVMCHISDLHSVADGIRILLKPDGVLIFEDPYLGDIVQKVSYDQIYDEHAFYFCVMSLSRFFASHQLEIIDVEHQDVHGGSMRYTIAHKDAYPASPRVSAQLEKERGLGLDRIETYHTLRLRIEDSRAQLVALLRRLKAEGKRVVGYGATSKSTTVANYCGITAELIEFISDTTPIKQGKFSPGAHIPVRHYAEFKANPPDYALLFAWNHANEILDKETAFVEGGGKWIIYVPCVEVLG